MVNVDADKIVRVIENSLTNAVKYSFKLGKIKIGMHQNKGYVIVYINNKVMPYQPMSCPICLTGFSGWRSQGPQIQGGRVWALQLPKV